MCVTVYCAYKSDKDKLVSPKKHIFICGLTGCVRIPFDNLTQKKVYCMGAFRERKVVV